MGILFFFFTTLSFSQVGININNSAPDPSAGLDVSFTDKGVLLPRLNTAQMLAIPSPAEGLLIYNTDLHGFVYYDSTGWSSLNGKHFIGEHFGGGIIFYLDGTGEHGLIVTTEDQPMGDWGCFLTLIPGTSTELGTGQANTTILVNGCPSTSTAAFICDNLTFNGYSDWYLPSRDELIEIYNHRQVIGNYVPNYYWSSSEYSDAAAWSQEFNNGSYYGRAKYDVSYVRAIRSF